MCRNIRTLFNFEPPATEVEIRDASLQFVRKLSGFSVPSKANEEAFERAVESIAASARSCVRMSSESVRALGQPRETKAMVGSALAGAGASVASVVAFIP